MGTKKVYTEEFVDEVRRYCELNRTSHGDLMEVFPFLTSETFVKTFLKVNNIGFTPFTKEEKLIRYKEKIKKNYGVENVFQLKEVKDKIKETNLEKYGVESYTQTEEYINKTKEINLEKYGVEWAVQNIDIQNKKYNTVWDRYGTKTYSQTDECKEKVKATNTEKLGVAYSFQSEEVKNKIKETLINRYGVDNVSRIGKSEAIINIVNDKDLFENFIMNIPKNKRTLKYIVRKLREYDRPQIGKKIVDYGLLDDIARLYSTSSYELELQEILDNNNIEYVKNARDVIEHMELDIYIPRFRVAIEFNGTYYHSEKFKNKDYHFTKSKLCEDKNIRLIHIFEYQWLNHILRNILVSNILTACQISKKIYARKCKLRELSKDDVELFSIENSIFGHRNASLYIGLFYEGELVQLHSWGHAFFSKNKNYDYECIRSITKTGVTVVGGMSKLFKYFLDKYKPRKLLYYVDYNIHNGHSLENIGFKFIKYTKYGVVNISRNKKTAIKYGGWTFNRNPSRHMEIKKDIADNNILQLFNSGNKVYEWNAED